MSAFRWESLALKYAVIIRGEFVLQWFSFMARYQQSSLLTYTYMHMTCVCVCAFFVELHVENPMQFVWVYLYINASHKFIVRQIFYFQSFHFNFIFFLLS